MTHILYEFLHELPLYEDAAIESGFRSISDKQILNASIRLLENGDTWSGVSSPESLPLRPPGMSYFTGLRTPPVSLLKQSSLYADEFIVMDPVGTRMLKVEKSLRTRFPEASEHDLKRLAIADTLRYLKALEPMVAAGYVTILSFSDVMALGGMGLWGMHYLPIGDPLPYPSDLDRSLIEDWLREHGQWRVTQGRREKESIFDVEVSDQTGTLGPYDFQVGPIPRKKSWRAKRDWRRFKEKRGRPDGLEAQVLRWGAHFIRGDVLRSGQLRTSLVTKSPEFFELLQREQLVENTAEEAALHTLVQLQVPIVEGIAVPDLMRVREEYGEAFLAFRRELEKRLFELKLERDPGIAEIRAQQLARELATNEVQAMDANIRLLRKSLLADATVIAVSLATAVQTSGISLLAALVAAAQGYKSALEYRKMHLSPSFFLWKLNHASNRDPVIGEKNATS